ncbi:MAG: exodeoxyribonuclease V subunit beta [Rhodanobacteraceae bacterium]|nr:exodeoxyribonuclease V subunit beta [Rhodanobacteraceae bacterium]
MSAPRELDWRSLDLAGTTLIEASAGTGKTYNIALLYLRLLLERQLGVRQILVTTFTDAAAQELKARIRTRLLDAERALGGAEADAELRAWLADLAMAQPKALLQARLRLALSEIDLAPISTIHSFCRRVLTDFPFDTGVPFNLGELVDETALLRECVEDFWRGRFLVEQPDPWEMAMVLDGGPAKLMARVRALLSAEPEAILASDTDRLRHWWQAFCAQDHSALRATVDDSGAFKNVARSRLRRALHSLLEAVDHADPGRAAWSDLHDVLQADKLWGQWKQSNTLPFEQRPELKTLAQAQALFERVEQRVNQATALACAAFVRGQIRHRLQVRGQITYTTLIEEVHGRLHSARGEALAERLAEAWPAALIDEFQDTDARQWQIFQTLAKAPAAQTLILIGDPKQAIYAFRGGDIHAYLSAREALPPERVHSIRHNFRSHPALLRALNELYRLAGDDAFGGGQISYVPVLPGEPGRWHDSKDSTALHLRLVTPPGKNLDDRDDAILEACADDIAHLLNRADLQIDGQPIEPGHVAVLLSTNRQISDLRARLIERRVPVVGSGKTSVLDTPWADDLQLLLHALLNANDDYAVRGALATRLLGFDASQLAAMAHSPSLWETQLARFGDWRQLWDRRGILAVIESIVLQQAPRLLAAADGERALTDLRHLGEVLQAAAAECYGPEELYAWLIATRSEGLTEEDASRELQLRIESEARRVQLLTLHASKGLEFPVVFVPMAWRHRKIPSVDWAVFHDGEHRRRLDLGSANFTAHKLIEAEEDMQESLRRLYVALTRAKYRCQIYACADVAPSAESARPGRGELDILLGAALARASARHDGVPWEALTQEVPGLALSFEADAPAEYTQAPASDQVRQARTPSRVPRPRFGLHSFSSLTQYGASSTRDNTRGAEDEITLPGEAVPVPDAGPAHPLLQALSGLKGPRFGDAMHQLLEEDAGKLRFAQQIERIEAALQAQGVRLDPAQASAQLRAIAAMLDRCLQSELAPGLKLGRLPAHKRRPEFEFAFALDAARWGRLGALLQAHGLGDWWPPADDGRVLRGLMKGYIDLLFEWKGRFHVLDYKSNWLGDSLNDYQPERLEASMREHRYGLQALVYSVALHRYLGQRIDDYRSEDHLGESWYLFLRAIGLGPGAGLWRRSFPVALIEALDALFDGAEVQP